jgi:hypothetical protein
MANFIRLKQIESGSALNTAAQVGNDFSQSVINVITSEVSAVLPEGVISSSAQVVLSDTTGSLTGSRVVGGTQASSIEYENILNRPTLVSGSSQVIDILNPLNQHSASINQFTASLDNTFATDAELTLSQSNINIDMGEW